MNPIESLIKQGESQTLEFVATLTDKDIIASHVAALLNSGGGRLLIGVDDNRRVAGIPEAEKVAGELPAPVWAVDEDGITLTLHGRASIGAPELNLNKRQNRLLTELNPGSSITLSDYLKRFADEVGDRQARRDLKELEAKDLLNLVGKGRAAHYERTARNWKE